MKYKEFVDWCNNRCCDGCWGMKEAIICTGLIEKINSKPFWKRKKEWEKSENEIVSKIVEPINKMILERRKRR